MKKSHGRNIKFFLAIFTSLSISVLLCLSCKNLSQENTLTDTIGFVNFETGISVSGNTDKGSLDKDTPNKEADPDTPDKGHDTSDKDQEEPDKDEKEPSPEEPDEPEKPSPNGSLENPYNAKKPININYEDYQYYPSDTDYASGKFKVTLKKILTGKKAYEYLKALDTNEQKNFKPKKGYQWLVLKYEINYKKGSINEFDASYLINPYSNFFGADNEKITSFSKYKPFFGKKEYEEHILRAKISPKQTKNLWTAIIVKNDQLPVYYRICTGYTKEEGEKKPVYTWFKIPKPVSLKLSGNDSQPRKK